MKYPLRRLSLLVLTGALFACGFHLRGSADLPEHLSPMFIDRDSMSLPLYRELRSALKAGNAELTTDPALAASTLTVNFEQQSRDVISVDTLGRAREYRLKYRLTFSLLAAAETVIDRSRIRLDRNLLFNPETVLGVAQEQENIYKDMIADSSRQIVQRLRAMEKQPVQP